MNRQKIIHKIVNLKENKKLSNDFSMLIFSVGEVNKHILPGNFVMIGFPEREDLILARPFSIFDVESNCIKILYKIVGKGTKYLSELTPGAQVSCTFPLGNSFTKPDKNDFVFLIGGGFGAAPLNFYLRTHENLDENIKLLIGAQTKSQLPFANLIVDLNKNKQNIMFATDDGTFGFKGFVTELLAQELNKFNKENMKISGLINLKIKACGPLMMLKAIKKVTIDFAQKTQISPIMEFSLEERMACGFGVCNGCVVQTTSGYKRVCKEGPVFNADDLIFS